MTEVQIRVLCAVLGVIVSAVFGYLAWHRNDKSDNESSGEIRGVMQSDIGYIKAGVDDLKRENRDMNITIGGVTERITRCEESVKQAHHRIDELKGGD